MWQLWESADKSSLSSDVFKTTEAALTRLGTTPLTNSIFGKAAL